jgi:hypothetical protein
VIGQAAGRDVLSGSQLIRFYGRLTVLGGLAAVVGPLLGGQLNTFLDCRGLFAFLALVGVVLLGGGGQVVREDDGWAGIFHACCTEDRLDWSASVVVGRSDERRRVGCAGANLAAVG